MQIYEVMMDLLPFKCVRSQETSHNDFAQRPVVCDINLQEEINGIELVKKYHRQEQHGPVVFLTAYSNSEIMESAEKYFLNGKIHQINSWIKLVLFGFLEINARRDSIKVFFIFRFPHTFFIDIGIEKLLASNLYYVAQNRISRFLMNFNFFRFAGIDLPRFKNGFFFFIAEIQKSIQIIYL